MKAKPHPDYDRIRAAMNSLMPLAAPFRKVCYRCVDTAFAHEIVSGEGAATFGGRWNPAGSFATVYLSDTPETALEEFLARARRMHWPDYKSLPMMMAGVEVKARRLLDLREPAVAEVLEAFSTAEKRHWRALGAEREAASQAIGRAARECGVQGLLAASVQVKEGMNIIVFPDTLEQQDKLSAPKLKVLKLS